MTILSDLTNSVKDKPIVTGALGIALGAGLSILYERHAHKCSCDKVDNMFAFSKKNSNNSNNSYLSKSEIKKTINSIMKSTTLTSKQQNFLTDNAILLDLDQVIDIIVYKSKLLSKDAYKAVSWQFYKLMPKYRPSTL